MLTLRRIHVLVVKHMRAGGFVEEALVGFVPVTRLEGMTDDLRRTLVALKQKKGSPFPEPHPDRVRLSNGQRAERVAIEDERARVFREQQQSFRQRLESE